MAPVMDLCDQFALNERTIFPVADDEEVIKAIELGKPLLKVIDDVCGTYFEQRQRTYEFQRIMLDEDIMNKITKEEPDNEQNYH